jgi:hypothetical protein
VAGAVLAAVLLAGGDLLSRDSASLQAQAPEPVPSPATPDASPVQPRVEEAPAVDETPAIVIDAMVISVQNGQVVLTVGSDDKVELGLEFRVLRQQAQVGVVTVVAVQRDSCLCNVTELAPGEAVQLGDHATARRP